MDIETYAEPYGTVHGNNKICNKIYLSLIACLVMISGLQMVLDCVKKKKKARLYEFLEITHYAMINKIFNSQALKLAHSNTLRVCAY